MLQLFYATTMPQGNDPFPPDEPVTRPDHKRSERYRSEHERFLAASLQKPKRRGRVTAGVVLFFIFALIGWTLAELIKTAVL